MAAKKVVVQTTPEVIEVEVSKKRVEPLLSVDLGRDELNNLARKLNEVIDIINS